ncbi:hypothetical protein HN018_12185 [Lichenicola cladoniae]|uniref:Uncharacterized protein n=1 Tax=Lichenicola cladoniae TaxID=1484109 RepID=A0A6M8HQH6_9PROT|nr:hypothetical protein [Lichenicola cladoniae]NPD68123.1 hypothetical protein [Acetobacteraceae bacterium]QKE90694.1 hypothetical protein HN018_12185 [Lichenicola cladoniae]
MVVPYADVAALDHHLHTRDWTVRSDAGVRTRTGIGNHAVLADFSGPAALARLNSLLMRNTTMHVSLDDVLHTGFDVALDRVGPKLDQVFVCARQHASALPERVPAPDRVRMGDWISMRGIGCTVPISGPGHAMIIMLAATGPGADTVGFSLGNDG